ncbi:MAG: hypothetical protein ABI839_08145 [Verrucomicrobiota bacterium]
MVGWRGFAFCLVWALSSMNAAQAQTASNIAASHSIAILERIRRGGVEQTIFLGGDASGNSILLILHGGPGMPKMPIWRANQS